jgi:ATP-dependent helicase/DNAse subunit B
LDPEVGTFAWLAGEVAKHAGLLVRVISPLERKHLLRLVIAEAAADGRLKYFGGVARSAGLLNLLDRTVARNKRGDVTPEQFQAANRGGLPRQRELAELYARYEAALSSAKLVDGEGLLIAARDALRGSPALCGQLALVVADGFTDFTAVELQILELLAQRSARTIVTLLGEDIESSGGDSARPELFAKASATRNELEQLGGKVRPFSQWQSGAKSGRKDNAATPAALAHLERNLFRDFGKLEPISTTMKKSLDRLQIVAASSEQAEIEEISRRVKSLLVSGVSAGDVVVAFRSMADLADRVRAAFDDFGIPLLMDAPRPLATTPLVRSLLSLVRLHAEDWPYRRLLTVLADRSLSFAVSDDELTVPSSPVSRNATHRRAAELCVRHAQLPSGRESLLEQAAAWAEGDEVSGACEPRVAKTGLRVLGQLAAAFDELPERGGIEEWVEAIERLGERVGLLSSGMPVPNAAPLPSPPLKGEGAGTNEVWQALSDGLSRLASLDQSGGHAAELSARQFIELLETTADELAAPEDRDATGKIRVLSAEAARFVRPKHLFVGRLNEPSFSHGAIDSRRRGGEEEEPAADARSAEMLLFYQLVTRPSESLTLSYPALDAKGQSLPASPFLVELERCFVGVELPTTKQPLNYQSQHSGPPLSRSDLRHAAVIQAEDRKRDILAAMIRSPRYGTVGRSILAGIEAVGSRADKKFGRYEGVIASDEVQAVLERKYGAEYTWSPSKLETYATCPYRFFGENVLELAPLPELALESDLARRGSLLHDTLARLYTRLNAAREEGVVLTPEAVAEKFEETLNAIVHSRPRRGLEAVLREIERRQIASWAKSFAAQHHEYASAWSHLDGPLVPRHFEARFGPKNRRSESDDDASLSTDRAFELTVGRERLRFAGQIDRIDVGRVGGQVVFNVIDYKTSASARVKDEQIAAGMQIQLPLYAMAVAELLLADEHAAPLSAGYWSIRGKGFGLGLRSGGPLAIGEIRDGRVQLSSHWTELRETLLGRIGEIVTGIRHGWFPVVSGDEHCTAFCPLSTGCRIAHVRSLEKAWLPPKEEGE